MLVRFATFVALLSACTGANSTGIEPIECPPEGTPLTYENFGDEVIANHCISCHDREGPTLLDQRSIQRHASAILDEAVYTDAMPKDANMPLAEREKLGQWLSCGAP